jgi:tRNA pseudouridine55 synthase
VNDGIILLSKPAGKTSFQALGSVKRALATGKIGHTGTLDRFAEGLLLVLSGRLTRLCPLASGLEKEYIAQITFGKGTDTLDPEGRIVEEGPIPEEENIRANLGSLTGGIMQVPPQFSAVHIGGRRAYEAARAGDTVILQPRAVTIRTLEMTGYNPPFAELRIVCSKGTYIRALARDLAIRLGTCAFVSRLARVRIGNFTLEEATAPESFDPRRDVHPPLFFFERCQGVSCATVKIEWERKIALGVPVTEASFITPTEGDGIIGAFTYDGRLLALLQRNGGSLRYLAVLADGGGT